MNKQIFRSFQLRNSQPDSETQEIFQELIMYTLAEGPFGAIQLETGLRLDGASIWQTMIQDSASPANLTFVLRCGEMSYFISNIVPLFNPSNQINYELPSSSSEESSSF